MPGAQFLAPIQEDTEEPLFEVEVLECNWKIVWLFQQCEITESGISTEEILAVCKMHGIPKEERPALAEGVRYMSRAGMNHLHDNRKKR